jgi:hypothetical protein
MEIPLQGHGPDGETSTLRRAMELTHGEETAIEVVDEPVDGIGGAVGAGVIEGLEELLALGASSVSR